MDNLFAPGTSQAALIFFNVVLLLLIAVVAGCYFVLDMSIYILGLCVLALLLLLGVDWIILEMGLEGNGEQEKKEL